MVSIRLQKVEPAYDKEQDTVTIIIPLDKV